MKKYKLYSQALERQEQSKKLQKQKEKIQSQEEERRKQLPIPQVIPLKERYSYTCHICNDFIIFDTLWLNDFTGKYIPLNPDTMLPHKCLWKLVKKKK